MKAFQATIAQEGLNMSLHEDANPRLLDEGVLVVNGSDDFADVIFAAEDIRDAERRLIANFPDADLVGTLRAFHHWNAYVPSRGERGKIEQALANVAHAFTRCTDPDCEIHHPLLRGDDADALNALAFYEAGRRDGVLGPAGPYAGERDLCEDCGKLLNEDELAAGHRFCDSCESQRNFDRASL